MQTIPWLLDSILKPLICVAAEIEEEEFGDEDDGVGLTTQQVGKLPLACMGTQHRMRSAALEALAGSFGWQDMHQFKLSFRRTASVLLHG